MINKLMNHIERYKHRNFNPHSNLFRMIELQNQTGCNYSCPFCPQNKDGIKLPQGSMDKELYKKIIEELGELRFKGQIRFGPMDESTLDNRLAEFVSIAREQCLQATIVILTNGSKLERQLIRNLIDSGTSLIYVSDYTPNHGIISKINTMQLSKQDLQHFSLRRRSISETLTNRAGNVPESNIPRTPYPAFCFYPFEGMAITYNGKAIICCQDYLFKEVMGDVQQNTLAEIWCNNKYSRLRKQLLNFNRAGFICQKCDFNGVNVMLHPSLDKVYIVIHNLLTPVKIYYSGRF
ncbi:S-adenosyl-L-methionine-dependent 2-deoxy-scyllo-inosamine dehydrogenase [subsurface metagenome]